MADSPDYTPPKVWTWVKPNGGTFASVNRPISGPTHEKPLPVGRHPLQLYSLGTPNGVKVTILLEELLALGHAGAEYDAWLIDIGKGDQFGSGFVQINPNSKIPALLDRSTPKPLRVFESGSILLYLAEKFGAFLPTEPAAQYLIATMLGRAVEAKFAAALVTYIDRLPRVMGAYCAKDAFARLGAKLVANAEWQKWWVKNSALFATSTT